MEGYILWASHKDWNGNSPTFWRKNAQGYTSCLENMHIYPTYEDAARAASVNCFREVVPVKLSDIMQHAETVTTFQGCESTLEDARVEWQRYWSEV